MVCDKGRERPLCRSAFEIKIIICRWLGMTIYLSNEETNKVKLVTTSFCYFLRNQKVDNVLLLYNENNLVLLLCEETRKWLSKYSGEIWFPFVLILNWFDYNKVVASVFVVCIPLQKLASFEIRGKETRWKRKMLRYIVLSQTSAILLLSNLCLLTALKWCYHLRLVWLYISVCSCAIIIQASVKWTLFREMSFWRAWQ